ncbi:MAG: Ger(x)C family spore germination protein [Acetivibrionales bacterium]|jgi:spore germination protein KC
MRRLIPVAAAFCLAAFFLTACFDLTEVDDMTYVIVVGVDKGVSDKWRLTVKFPNMRGETGGNMGGGEGGDGQGGEGYEVVTVDAPSFFTGLDMINTSVSRELNFMHTKLIIFSEELAREGIVGEFIAPIIRYRQIRTTMHIAVCDRSAMEFVKEIKPSQGSDLAKYLEVLMEQSNKTGFFPHITLHDFYNSMKSTYHQPITIMACLNRYEQFEQDGDKWEREFKTGGEYYSGNIPRKGGPRIEFFGSAVFDGDKMVGKLNGDETRFLLMASDKFKTGRFTIPDPGNPELIVPFRVRKTDSPEVKVKFEGEKPVVELKLKLEGDILAVQSRINYEDEGLKPQLEEAFKQHVKEGLDLLIKKCLKWGTDVLHFGDHAVKNVGRFSTIQEWEEYNWNGHFKDSEVFVEVEFEIRRAGSMLKSEPVVTNKGRE